MDKKSPIARVIRRSPGSSDVLVGKPRSISSADEFFAGEKIEQREDLSAGTTVKWRSFCGIVGTGKIQKQAGVADAWMVECISPDPATWQKAGVPARHRDICIVYDWQLVRDT